MISVMYVANVYMLPKLEEYCFGFLELFLCFDNVFKYLSEVSVNERKVYHI